MGSIEEAGAGRAGSGEKNGRAREREPDFFRTTHVARRTSPGRIQ